MLPICVIRGRGSTKHRLRGQAGLIPLWSVVNCQRGVRVSGSSQPPFLLGCMDPVFGDLGTFHAWSLR